MRKQLLCIHAELLDFCLKPKNKEECELITEDQSRAERLLLAELARHLTPREYYVIVSRFTGQTTTLISQAMSVGMSAVRSTERTAKAKIAQPWRLRDLRRRLRFSDVSVKKTDRVDDWFEVSLVLAKVLRLHSRNTLEEFDNSPSGWWTRHKLSSENELELHRLINGVRTLIFANFEWKHAPQ